MSRSTLALFLFLSACPGPTPEPQSMARDLTLSARGLYDNPNPLSEVPDGAFSRADDVVIRRPGIVETRRGFAPGTGSVGAGTDRFLALHDFAGTLVGHTSAGTLARYDGTAWTPYDGTYSPPAGRRTRFLQTASSLYFTTDKGVQRLDEALGAVVPAGVPQALAGTATVTGTLGFLPPNSATAYRYVWGYRNANDRVILGAPSPRMTVRNGSMLVPGTAGNVALTVPIPSWVTEDYFLQVYRADTSASADIVPGDDMGLVYEAYPTGTEIAARTMTLPVDATPDELKAAFLYSSPNAGQPGSEKFQPPVCTDLTDYKDRMWMGCTTQRQRLQLTLLSVDSTSGGLAIGDGIIFTNSLGSEFYTAAAAEDASLQRFQVFTTGTPSQNIANTAASLAKVISTQPSGFLSAFYTSSEFDAPGSLSIEARDLDAPLIDVRAYINGAPWQPALPVSLTASAFRVSNVVTVNLGGVHTLVVGQQVELLNQYTIPADATNFPPGLKTITAIPAPNQFQYAETAPNANTAGTLTYVTTTPPIRLDPSDDPNSLAYSEFGEPDAVPLANYLPVGSANYALLRVMTLGDTLMLFKEDGTFTLSGDTPETFNVREYPNPAKLLAPDSLVKLANSIYALTDQGVMTFMESGARTISNPIEGRIKALIASDPALADKVRTLAFGMAYETEREYWLFLPSTVADTTCTQAYVYNYLTGAWTHWTVGATAGHVLPGQDKAYLGRTDANAVRAERKTRTSTDYQDADGVPIQTPVTWQVRTGDDAGAYKQWVKGAALLEKATPGSPEVFVQPPDQLTLSCATEVDPTAISGPFDTQGLPYVGTYIPEEHSRSQVLSFGVSGGQVGRRMSLTGLSVDYVSSSTKLR